MFCTAVVAPPAGQFKRSLSNRQRRRDRKRAAKHPRDHRYRRRVRAERGRTDAQERAYFARWPQSAYPGLHMVHRQLASDELRRIWFRSFERWQRVRMRFLRMFGRTVDDRVIIHRTSLFFRDMRAWECRRCGWDFAHVQTWRWWCGLELVQRMAFVDASWQKGVRFAQRRAWQRARAAA